MAGLHQALKAEPNLTPILDMVFQLVTFFMLVINFKAASLDTSLQLPVIGSALPIESGRSRRARVECHARRQAADVRRRYATSRAASPKRRGARSRAPAERRRKRATASELPTTVIIRADRTTPYHFIHQVIQACQTHGFRNFQYRALSTGT